MFIFCSVLSRKKQQLGAQLQKLMIHLRFFSTLLITGDQQLIDQKFVSPPGSSLPPNEDTMQEDVE